jgi:hypothetical protein
MEKTRENMAFQAALARRLAGSQVPTEGLAFKTEMQILFEQVEANRLAIEEMRAEFGDHRHSLPHKPNGPFQITSAPNPNPFFRELPGTGNGV